MINQINQLSTDKELWYPSGKLPKDHPFIFKSTNDHEVRSAPFRKDVNFALESLRSCREQCDIISLLHMRYLSTIEHDVICLLHMSYLLTVEHDVIPVRDEDVFKICEVDIPQDW